MAETATKKTRARASRARKKQDAGDGITPADREALEETGEERAYDPADHGGTVAAAATSKLMDVPVALIEIEPGFNPRQSYDEDAIESLAQSLVMHGLVQPVLLRPKPGTAKPPRFYLTGGHRRFKAAVKAGLQTVPAIIRSDGDVLAAAVLDNSHRVDLNPYEEALVYQRAMTERGLTARGVAERFSVPQKRVTERLRILNTPEVVREAVGAGVISSAPATVQWYVELQEKSPKLAAAIGAADVKADGQLDREGIKKALKATAGVVDGGEIRAGSKAFKLRTDEVRAAVKLLEGIESKYSGPEYSWRHGAGSKHVKLRRFYGEGQASIDVPEAIWQEGEKLGTVVLIEAGQHHRPLVAVIDPKWLQDRLEQALLEAAKSLRAAIAKDRSSTSGKKASELSAAEQREKTQRAAEREKKNREREQAREGNNRLGPALLNHMASVPLTMDSAKALCLLLLKQKDRGGYSYGDHVGHLAAGGLRFAFPEWKKTVQMKRGEKVELETDVAELERRFWEWWNAASTPEEVIGRTLITFAAMHYHDGREALSKEFVSNGGGTLPGHNDAASYLERLFDAHAPAGLRKRKAGKGTVRSSSKTLAEVFDDQGVDEADAAEITVEPAPAVDRRTTALQLITDRPGITVPELAEAMSVAQNYLYRILPDMQEEGLVIKSGRGWHRRRTPGDDDAAIAAAAAELSVRTLAEKLADTANGKVLLALAAGHYARGREVAGSIEQHTKLGKTTVDRAVKALMGDGLVNPESALASPSITALGHEVAARTSAVPNGQ